MTSNHLLLEAIGRLEAQLLADFEAVRRIRVLLTGGQTAGAEIGELAALVRGGYGTAPAAPAVVTPVALPPAVPAPTFPQQQIRDVRVAVKEIVAGLAGAFGIGEVKKQLRVQHYRTFADGSIRTTLQRMEQAGELSLVSRGSGRAGNKYAATINAQPAPTE